MVGVVDGAPITTTGGVLSTLNVVAGPHSGAVPPPSSLAVPATIEIPSVPSPVMLPTVTVRVVLPLPLTLIVPLAVPVLFSVTCELSRPIESAPVYETVYVTGPVFVSVVEGPLTEMVSGVLSTVTRSLGPAPNAELPAVSEAVPAATEMPSVPSPVILLIVTVRALRPEPLMLIVPLAVPVLLSVTLAAVRDIELAPPPYSIVYVTGPEPVQVVDGPSIATVGGVLSTSKSALGPAAGAKLAALSLAVPAAIEIPSVPSPVMLLIVTVRVVLPEPLTETEPLAVPVLFNVTFAAIRVRLSAPS